MKTDMTAALPPMGWNSWNTFYDRFDETLIKEMADVLADGGYAECGYRYLILDDCWLSRERGKDGRLVPDPAKFPNGIRSIIDYVHDKGLKFGIYGCCGVKTCAGYPGSFEREAADAETFAGWGVDYLKYDNCHRPSSVGSELLYRRMSYALRNSGREILLAACQWGTEEVGKWIRSTGAHTYRSTVDIRDSWESIRSIAEERLLHLDEGGPGCYNDMDMLVVGMHGAGANPETTAEGCSMTEYTTHFALWAMLNSPLIIGCDLRSADNAVKNLLTNRDLIAINQDPEGRTCYKLACSCSPGTFTLIKPLSGGDYAAGIFNFSDHDAFSGFPLFDMGLSSSQGQKVRVHDVLSGNDTEYAAESISAEVLSHGCRIFRLSSAV